MLPVGSLFAVGGRVRDSLRSEFEQVELPAKDLDYVVTGLSLDELVRVLAPIGRVDVVGASFSVLKLTADGTTADVALPRRERSVGSGHRDFEVQAGADIPLEDDLARRDFRMNMIARGLPNGEMIDPYGGTPDIRARRIDILSEQTFVEDPLRMLRACQFAARFGYQVSDRTQAAMRESARLTHTISAQRVCDELTKLLALAQKPSIGLELMRETGLLAEVWPELLEGVGVEQNEWHAFEVYRHNLESMDAVPPGDLTARLAALLHDVGKPRVKDGPHFYRHEHVGADMADAMLARFRFPAQSAETVVHLVRQHMYSADPSLSDAAIRRFIRRIGPANLDRQFGLRAADIAGSGLPKREGVNEAFQARVWAEVERKPPFSIADLQIDGSAVVTAMIEHGLAPAGFRGDQRVGEALRVLFEQVTDKPERNEPKALGDLLDAYLAAKRRNVSRETRSAAVRPAQDDSD
ncbi:MAG: HD domain-containing protein [Candidatus Eremiobacteraeota bacterium]|nr:HD domain-containing protein [Candidatus Eremiobacteraeota bacterium]